MSEIRLTVLHQAAPFPARCRAWYAHEDAKVERVYQSLQAFADDDDDPNTHFATGGAWRERRPGADQIPAFMAHPLSAF